MRHSFTAFDSLASHPTKGWDAEDRLSRIDVGFALHVGGGLVIAKAEINGTTERFRSIGIRL